MPSSYRSITSIDWVASAVVAKPIFSIFYLLSDWPFCFSLNSRENPQYPLCLSRRVFKTCLTACKCSVRRQASDANSATCQIQSRSAHLYPLYSDPLYLLPSQKVLFSHPSHSHIKINQISPVQRRALVHNHVTSSNKTQLLRYHCHLTHVLPPRYERHSGRKKNYIFILLSLVTGCKW